METVKKNRKRRRSFLWIAIVLGLLIAAAVCWLLFFWKKSYSVNSNVTAYVDGRIEVTTDADALLKKFYNAEFADVVQSGGGEAQQIALVFLGTSEETEVNQAVLTLLQERELTATFALSAADALQWPEFVDNLLVQGHELISNTATGESNMQSLTAEKMLSSMQRGREALATSSDTAVDVLYCTATALTADVLQAATATGFSSVVSDEAQLISPTDLKTEALARGQAASAAPGAILVVSLRGDVADIQYEPPVYAAPPVIDLQPTVDEETTPPPEEADLPTRIGWLLDGLAGWQTVPVSKMPTVAGETVLAQQMERPDAHQALACSHLLTNGDAVGLGYIGIPEKKAVSAALDALEESSCTLTLFLTGEQMESRKADIEKFMEAGCSLGLYLEPEKYNSRTSSEILETMRQERQQLQRLNGEASLIYAPQQGQELVHVRRAASLLGCQQVIVPGEGETVSAGTLLMTDRLTGQELHRLSAQAADAGLALTDVPGAMEDSGTLDALSLQQLEDLRRENDGQTATLHPFVSTTQRAASLCFYNLGNDHVAMDAADILREKGMQGTFFVTLEELMEHPTTLEYIRSQGHEVAIFYRQTSIYPQTFEAVASYINSWQRYARWRYGIDVTTVFTTVQEPQAQMLEAVNALGCQIVRSTWSAVKDEDRNITAADVDSVAERLGSYRMTRGAFVCFNMNHYAADGGVQRGESVLCRMLERFVANHIDPLAYCNPEGEIEDASRFRMITASALLASPGRYTLIEREQSDISADNHVLADKGDNKAQMKYISQRYIGSKAVASVNELPGFEYWERSMLDTTGVFTNDPVLFLTFDDWGTEQSINELLYILEKHNVKATFFVRTEYVDNNPNLLRAIAEQGHQIACHTNTHMALSVEAGTNPNHYGSITDEAAAALRQDIVEAYNKLYYYTGGVVVNGKPALSRMFRPPTLAVSKRGLQEVFDVGFTYSVSGSFSTGDYLARNLADAINRLTIQSLGWYYTTTVQSGTVVVMHMQENAKYTAQALDVMIPRWKERGLSFARLDDYLNEPLTLDSVLAFAATGE